MPQALPAYNPSRPTAHLTLVTSLYLASRSPRLGMWKMRHGASRHALDKRAPCAHSYGLLFQCPSLWGPFKLWRVNKSALPVFCWRHMAATNPLSVSPPSLPVAVPPIHRNHPSRARRAAREYPVNISRPRRRADFKPRRRTPVFADSASSIRRIRLRQRSARPRCRCSCPCGCTPLARTRLRTAHANCTLFAR